MNLNTEQLQCFDSHGWINAQLGYLTDLYSHGMLIWRMLYDDQDPFQSLTEIDHAPESIENTVQRLKKDNHVALIAMQHAATLKLRPEISLIIEERLFCSLQADPLERKKCLRELSKVGGISYAEFSSLSLMFIPCG